MDVDPIPTPPIGGPDKSSTGMEPNVAAGIACIMWLTGLIFFLIEKDSKFVKFYGFQSLVFGLTGVLCAIPFLGWAYSVVFLVVWIMQLINAFQGKIFRIPVIGNIAANQAGL
jgi:uncharacterized membrane protein